MRELVPMGRAAPDLEILLIENDRTLAAAIRTALAADPYSPFELQWVTQPSEGIEHLRKKRTAAILLGLSVSGSHNIEALDVLFRDSPDLPILILGADNTEACAKNAVAHGAQDYLLPQHLEYCLPRAIRNAIERKVVERASHLKQERALITLDSLGDAVLCTDISGNITYLNRVAEKMTGWPAAEAVSKPLAQVFQIIDEETRQGAPDPLQMAVEQNKTVGLTANCILIRRDGFKSAIEDSAAPIHDREGCLIGAVIVFRDVSGARAISRQMAYAAQHDVLTGLPNRLLFNDRMTQAISFAHRQRRPLALLFLDLDHFKKINDRLGHTVGDELLKSISQRLLNCVRDSDTVSRQGGDEFTVLLPEVTLVKDAATCAAKIIFALDAPHMIGGHSLHIGTSIGISIYPTDGRDFETLIKSADTAMYRAKENGRGHFQFFQPEMNSKIAEQQSFGSKLIRKLKLVGQ
ncbi:MAG: diguanylate cyclase [Candidatus Acidiferrales bacterium]